MPDVLGGWLEELSGPRRNLARKANCWFGTAQERPA
jgi:hypothetical protein